MPDSLTARTVNHDVAAGPLDHCQICGSTHLREIIDLGHQPLCDALLTKEQLREPEVTYPLALNQCEECTLAQLSYVVPPEKVYPADYPYKAGISWPVVEAHRQMAEALVKRFGKGFVIDVGCNDGTLLAQFKERGCDTLGFEPTGIAAHAAVVNVLQERFTKAQARLVRCFGEAHIITFTNVFAHMADLGEVCRGICHLLAKDGVLVIENHYLGDVLEKNQFDTIYHEHIRTYSLKSLVTLFRQYGLEVFDVEMVSRYGGNIRVYVGWPGMHDKEITVANVLQHEEQRGLGSPARWAQFRLDALDARDQFMTFLHDFGGESVVACSAPGRASTLLNFYGVKPDLLPWTGELKDSLKLGKYLPGCHIPVVSNQRIIEEQPEAVVLLAWHYAEEIMTRLRREGFKGSFLKPLPYFEVIH